MLSELRKATRSVAALLLWVASNALWPAPGSERESIWSVSKANATLFFNLTFVIWTGTLTLLSLDEWARRRRPSPPCGRRVILRKSFWPGSRHSGWD